MLCLYLIQKNIVMLYFLIVLSFYLVKIGAVEWDCASTTNTGPFTRSTDCKISGSNHVAVSNTLEIVGSNTDMNHLITISAASKNAGQYIA